jgi:GTPase SAR1 family protein
VEIKKFSLTNHFIKALVYGASGSGKTSFAGTAPKAIFASAEGGLMSIAHFHPSFVDIRNVDDLKQLLTYLKTQKHEYQTVIIDSISEINEIIKAGIEQKNGKSMQLQDWQVVQRTLRAIFRGFRDLPMHVLFLCQENMEMDEQKISKIVPSLNGKAATEIAYFMDIVGYLRIDPDGTRHLITEPNSRYLTKDRSRVIGNETPIDFGVWMNKISKLEVQEQTVEDQFGPKVPHEDGDKILSKDQLEQVTGLWIELMVRKETPEVDRPVKLEAVLHRDYGVKSSKQLRAKQANHFIDNLIKWNEAEIAKKKEQDQPTVAPVPPTNASIANDEREGMKIDSQAAA